MAAAAHRPEPSGVRFVLGNCSEPGREAELDEWYDAYAADCTRPGLLVNAIRYQDPGAAADDEHPRYAAVYDIVAPDPENAWPQTHHHPSRVFQQSNPLLSVVLRSTYRRIGPILPVGSKPLPGAIAVALSDCDDRALAREHNDWFADHFEALIGAGAASRATRYEIVEGSPNPPRFLEIYEADALEHLDESVWRRPDGLTLRLAGAFARTFAYP